ncbi:MAG: class I SAM-dependent DNA methyltransferase, partial [Prevotella sp.]
LDAEGNFLGFDCIIGNPPYIQLQSMGKSADILERMGYVTYSRTGDIYCLFYELGVNLLVPNGYICYITSNKWMRAGYGKYLRNYFTSQTNPIMLVDFAGIKIFDAIKVDANILLSQKATNLFNTQACSVQDTNGLNNLSDFVQQEYTICKFSGDNSWVILSPIEQSIKRKIEAVGTPLKDWDINIYRGVLTGCNEAFIIGTTKREEILHNCQTEDERKRTAELIRPILRGRDIKRYGYEWAELWLIATFPSRHYDIDDYPSIKQYLLSYRFERLEQTGKVHIVNGEKVKARKKTNNKWFETQDSISYWEDFNKPKIMYSEIVREPQFFFDVDGKFYPEATSFIMTGDGLETLYRVFHTSLATYLFKRFYAGGGLGEKGYRYKKAFFEDLPIPKALLHQQIDELSANESLIRLYGLSSEEVSFIESQQNL